MRTIIAAVFAVGLAVFGGAATAQETAPSATFTPEIGMPGKDVIWMPTVDTLLTAMLDAAAVKPGELVIDLGSGDGRIPIVAARDYGARARGIEYNPDLVTLSRENARKAGVAEKVEFIEGDIFKLDWSMADVLTLYLLPEINLQIREDILKMRPGVRVISNSFTMGDWKPDRVLTVDRRNAYFWVVPADVSGKWRLKPATGRAITLQIEQKYQKILSVQARRGGRALAVADASLAGPDATFKLADGKETLAVRVNGDRMTGTIATAEGAPVGVTGKRTPRH
ncbi:MAG: methyltransferase domain-containing protein [Caulobacterales bacterium]